MTTSRPSAADLDIHVVTIPELGEPIYGGRSFVYGDGPMREAVYTRLPVTNLVEVDLHGEPHRMVHLDVDNETGAVHVYFVRQTKGRVRRDWKLANRFVWLSLGEMGLRHPAKPAHHAIADAVDAALAPLRVEDESAPADEFPANGDMMVVAGPIPAAMADRGVVPGQRVMVTEVDKTTPTVWVTAMAEDGIELDYLPSELIPATEPVHCPNHGPVEYLCCQPKDEVGDTDNLPFPTDAQIAARDCQNNTTCTIEAPHDAHEDQGGFDYLVGGRTVRAYDVFAVAVESRQRVLEIDGIAVAPLLTWDEEVGVLVESTRVDNQGYVHLTVWGASRMFEIELESNVQVRVTYPRP